MIDNSTIQCERERIRKDGRYMHRERKNMQRQLLFFSEMSYLIEDIV